MRFFSNSDELLSAVCLPCRGDHPHEQACGSNARISQVYTPLFADRFCAALKDAAKKTAPFRFGDVHDTFAVFVDISHDQDKWEGVLTEATNTVNGQSALT